MTYSIIYFASSAVALDSSRVTASSSTSWSRFNPPSNFVNGHVSTIWFVVCHWPQSQGDWARPYLCKLADCRLFGAIGKKYKLFLMGNEAKTDGVGIFVAEKWADSVIRVEGTVRELWY